LNTTRNADAGPAEPGLGLAPLVQERGAAGEPVSSSRRLRACSPNPLSGRVESTGRDSTCSSA